MAFRRRRAKQVDERGREFVKDEHPGFTRAVDIAVTRYFIGLEGMLRGLEAKPVSDYPQGFWTKKVYAPQIYQQLRTFTQHNALQIQLNGQDMFLIKLIKILPTLNSLQIHYSVNDNPLFHEIRYPSKAIKDYCLGNWVSFGLAEFKCNPEYLLPEIKFIKETGSVLLSWPDGPEIRVKRFHYSLWFLNSFRITSAKIKSFEVTETQGTFDVRGLAGWFLPTILWSNDVRDKTF